MDLKEKHCEPCHAGTPPLSADDAGNMIERIPEWKLDESAKMITREYSFKNYYQTIAFVNAIAWISHREDHHPDMSVSYNRCKVSYSTHAIDGLSENDFICAAKADALLNSNA